MKTFLTASLIIICIPGLVMSAEFEIPNKFQPKEEIKAEKFNQNYKAIENEIAALRSSIEDALQTARQAVQEANKATKKISEAIEKIMHDSQWLPIDCFPSKNKGLFDKKNQRFNEDLYSCDVSIPNDGFLYLSLQGHQISRDGGACSFGIFVDGESINRASRDYPSTTWTKSWNPSFMADTLKVKKGKVKLSVRILGSDCSIHDPDINGLFIPIIESTQ